jgi:hypothetical protein
MAVIKFAPMAAQVCASPTDAATIDLGAAISGRSQFRLHIANGETMGFTIQNTTQWEESYGVLTHNTTDTLTRTVLRNHLGTTDRINFVGAATVVSHPPSSKVIVLDTAGDAALAGDLAVTGNITAADGTTGDEVVNFSQFAQSKAGDGYVTLPGNIRMQWGTESVTLSGNSATISFPSTFSSFYTLVVSNGSASTSQNDVTITGQNGTEFIVYVPDQATGSFVVNWIAIGAV